MYARVKGGEQDPGMVGGAGGSSWLCWRAVREVVGEQAMHGHIGRSSSRRREHRGRKESANATKSYAYRGS